MCTVAAVRPSKTVRGRRTTTVTGRVLLLQHSPAAGQSITITARLADTVPSYRVCTLLAHAQSRANNNTARQHTEQTRDGSLETTEVSHALRLASHRSTFRAFSCTHRAVAVCTEYEFVYSHKSPFASLLRTPVVGMRRRLFGILLL